ncbi:MAG: cytochrome c3 family protein [bacterium]
MGSVKNDIFFILVVLAFSFLVGCSHKVLTVFFDGVPESNDSTKVAVKKPAGQTDTLLTAEITANLAGLQNSVHPPFQNKKCILCHDPGSTTKLQTPQPGLCYVCHDDFSLNFKFIHGPVSGGFCTSCHNPHKSNFKKLLIRQGQELCLYCHDSKEVLKQAAHVNIGDADCITCHNPHGGNKRYFLAGNE